MAEARKDYSRITHDTRLPELEMYHSEFLEKPPNLSEQFILQLSAPTLLVAFCARIDLPAGMGNFKGVLTRKASTFFVVPEVADFLRFCVGFGGVFSILETFGDGYLPSIVAGFTLGLLKTAFVLADFVVVFSAPGFTTFACSGPLAGGPSVTSY